MTTEKTNYVENGNCADNSKLEAAAFYMAAVGLNLFTFGLADLLIYNRGDSYDFHHGLGLIEVAIGVPLLATGCGLEIYEHKR